DTVCITDDELLEPFTTDFWLEQHQWFVALENNDYSSTLFTIPYIEKTYTLRQSTFLTTSISLLSCYSSNVEKITVNFSKQSIPISSVLLFDHCYYSNARSLKLWMMDEDVTFDQLNQFIRISKLTNLSIECEINPVLFSKILDNVPNLNSLKIKYRNLCLVTTDFENKRICQQIKEKITKLNIIDQDHQTALIGKQIENLCQLFSSNLQQLSIRIQSLDDIPFILNQFNKLAFIRIQCKQFRRTDDIQRWLMNEITKLNKNNFTLSITRNICINIWLGK
ncbi:unnamed protein product, partial [Didymodactylos carnosus]